MNHIVKVILRSGVSFNVTCKECTTKIVNSKIVSYSFIDVTDNKPLFIDIEQIDAIITIA